MRRACFVVFVVFLGSCAIFAQVPQSITKVDRLCGYLVRETQKSRDSIAKETIALYRRESTIECCRVQDRIFEVQTKREGAYWVVAIGETREYRMAIEFAPSKDAQECSSNLYTIESKGNFVLKTYVAVS